jgi:SAM-dependent methyltransferase
MLNPATLRRIERLYRRRTAADLLERAAGTARERLFGVDCAVFARTIEYFRAGKGEEFSCAQALQRARDKERHKQMWFDRPRESLEDVFRFYREADVYPFRQPYNYRLGGYRWLARLVEHVERPSMLEYGCGSAALTEWLLQRFPRYRFTVADIPSTTRDFVEWKQERYSLPYEVVRIDPASGADPLRGSFDLIVCKDVLEHTPNPLDIVGWLVDHLAPGGVLVLDFLVSPGGENLERAVAQRDAVKALLATRLTALKAIDVPTGNDGLYVNHAAAEATPATPAAAEVAG